MKNNIYLMSSSSCREYVPAGDYLIADNKVEKHLTAILGTCVGIALVDKSAGLGGIIHILLPAPSNPSSPFQPLNYADPGLKIFIDKLLEAGASQEKLQATIAGGALFGPISSQDFNLDVGGRTVEEVMNILAQAKISVITSETGGVIGSTLMLNTKNLEPGIRPLFQTKKAEQKEIIKPSIAEIENLIEKTKPIPQIALKIIRLLRSEDHNMKEISEEVRCDQIICAKVLQYCNSSVVGLPVEVKSINQALVLIGENHLLEIIVSAAVETFFAQKEGGYSLMRGGLFKHALGVAHTAKAISQFTGRSQPEIAYTAGLLHDIGKIVLDHYINESFPNFYHNKVTDSSDFIDLERQVLGIDHQETGKRLAEKWNFPEALVDVIGSHHWPEEAGTNQELAHIIYLADLLSTWFLAGLEQENVNTKTLVQRLDHIGLKPRLLTAIIEDVPWKDLMYH